MRRYFVPICFFDNKDKILFKKDIFHHIFQVCKHKEEDIFEIINDRKKAYIVRVISVDSKQAEGKILEEKSYLLPQPPFLNLALSLCRLSTLDWVIEKCVELGVHQLQIFYSDHSFFKSKLPSEEKKRLRWEKIIHSCMAQSGRIYPLEILPLKRLEEVVEQTQRRDNHLSLALERDCPQRIKDIFHETSVSFYKNFWLFLGPEGGFSTQEVDFFEKKKIPIFHLKGEILKLDTACVSILSILKYKMNLW